MTTRSPDHLSFLTPAQRAEVDNRIKGFEQAWQRGDRPKIVDHLPTDSETRKAVFVELVRIDSEWRAGAGEPVNFDAYREQFPELAALLAIDVETQVTANAEVKTWPTTVIGPPVPEQAGSVIGPYKLIEQIGAGGFGLVYVAEQERPIRRKVAIKVIKPGMDTREVIARFEAERQALAMMDHPNIAKVLDAGATDSGRPYFVMEFVRGIAITDFCDQNHLTPRERLELFVAVCQAVQHAHQKGIIHRDIKPSNVLVTLHDGKPIVKVIDFGVAKALHQPLTDKTVYTQIGRVIGTPLYMSPEQAEHSGLDIDTRSDIYSLGVLLYELLTGTTPFDKNRIAKAAYPEVIRIIREEEPPKPSTRLSQSTESLSAIAGKRKTDPAKLPKMFRGDLDWITMKALEKDRARRYATAGDLAADILRYLHDEPVEATPPSAGYRLKKFARRHQTGLATASTFAALLVGAVIVSTWLALAAERSATLAKIETDTARKAQLIAEHERQQAVEQRKLAELERHRADDNATKAEFHAKQESQLLDRIVKAQREFAELKSQYVLLSKRELYPPLDWEQRSTPHPAPGVASMPRSQPRREIPTPAAPAHRGDGTTANKLAPPVRNSAARQPTKSEDTGTKKSSGHGDVPARVGGRFSGSRQGWNWNSFRPLPTNTTTTRHPERDKLMQQLREKAKELGRLDSGLGNIANGEISSLTGD